MNDPRSDAVDAIERLVSRARRGALPAEACEQLVEAVGMVPGRVRLVAATLSAQRDAAAIEALLRLPPNVPGVVEGVFGAMHNGVTRLRFDGQPCPHLLAIDFRRARAKSFTELVHRAAQVFDGDFERLDVGGTPRYRVGVREGPGTFAGRVAAMAQDIVWLHARLGRLKGTRLWLNGWCLAVDGPWKAPVQAHVLRAWLAWAAGQTQTRST